MKNLKYNKLTKTNLKINALNGARASLQAKGKRPTSTSSSQLPNHSKVI